MEIEQSWIVLDRKLKPTGSGKICERKGKIDIIKNSNIKTNRKTETKVDKLRWYENDGNKKLRWMDGWFQTFRRKTKKKTGETNYCNKSSLFQKFWRFLVFSNCLCTNIGEPQILLMIWHDVIPTCTLILRKCWYFGKHCALYHLIFCRPFKRTGLCWKAA